MTLVESHDGIAGGHYIGKKISQKILCARIWCSTPHKYVKEYYHRCNIFQRIGRPSQRDANPLHPKVTLQVFEKWEVYFLRPINPPVMRTGARYIITTIDYLIRWKEVELVTDCSAKITMLFLFEKIITRFGCPKVIMRNQGNTFMNNTIATLTKYF
jgi:hypothetical protein